LRNAIKVSPEPFLETDLEARMVRKRTGLRVAAVGVSFLGLGFSSGLWANDAPAKRESGVRIQMVASPSVIPKGSRCRIDLLPKIDQAKRAVETHYEGTIVEATDEGISLKVASSRLETTPKFAVANPIGRRLFRNVGIGRVDPDHQETIWLPAASIKTVILDRSDAVKPGATPTP
jgi:hypothetical protein